MCNSQRRELTIRFWELKGKVFFFCYLERVLIAELAEHSPIIIQNSSNPSSQKNLVLRLYDCTTVQLYKVLLLTCVVNCTTGRPCHGFVQQSSGQCTGLQVGRPGFQSWLGQGFVPLRLAGKKKKFANSAFRLG